MANIQLPPIQPDDFFRRLLKPQQNIPSITKVDSDKIEKTISEEEKLVDLFNDKIENIYKTISNSVFNQKRTTKIQENVEELEEKSSKFSKETKSSLNDIKTNSDMFYEAATEKITKHISFMEKTIHTIINPKVISRTTLDLTKTTYDFVSSSISNASTFFTKTLSVGLKFASGTIHCLSQFLLGPFKFAWNIVDSLLTKLNGPVWKAVKGVVSDAGKTMKWFLNVGISAASYIWKGFSTVFKIGYTVISKTVKYLALGTKAFFGWWFKMLTNTIFSPGLWFINIPLFLIISFAIISAMTGLLIVGGVLAPPIQALFSSTINVFESLGSWVWTGIQSMFNYVSNAYQHSTWLKPTVDSVYYNINSGISKWLGNHDHIKNAFLWIEKSYQWVKNNFVGVLRWVEDEYDKVSQFFKTTPRQTLLEYFIGLLDKFKDIPVIGVGIDVALNWLKSRYGFSFAGGVNYKLRQKIQQEKVLGFQETLQNAIMALPKGLNEKDYNDRVSDIIDKLQAGTFGGLSNAIVENVKSKVFDSIKKGEGAYSYTSVYQKDNYIRKLESDLKIYRSGILDAQDQKNIDHAQQIIDYGDFLDSYQKTWRQANVSPKDFDNFLKEMNRKNEQAQLTRTFATSSEIMNEAGLVDVNTANLVEGSKNALGQQANFFIKRLINTPYEYVTGRPELITPFEDVSHDYGNPGMADFNTYNDQIKAYQNEPQLAKGGIISPLKNIIPLDSVGKDYIREKVKNIQLPDEQIKTSKKTPGNITIIEEHSDYIESYEVYTMRQLSKGILGAN